MTGSRQRKRPNRKAQITLIGGLMILGIAVSGALINYWVTKPVSVSPTEESPVVPSVGPQELDVLFAHAIGAMQAGNRDLALGLWHEALEAYPQVPEIKVNIGFILLESGDYESADNYFSMALEQNAYQANAYYGLAICREKSGDLESALGLMKSFIHLAQPEHQAFVRKARSAIWEWESILRPHQTQSQQNLELDSRNPAETANPE